MPLILLIITYSRMKYLIFMKIPLVVQITNTLIIFKIMCLKYYWCNTIDLLYSMDEIPDSGVDKTNGLVKLAKLISLARF